MFKNTLIVVFVISVFLTASYIISAEEFVTDGLIGFLAFG